jgi:hypothetical protein
MLAGTFVITWLAWRWALHIPKEAAVAARAGLVTSAVFFTAVLMVWAGSAG